MHNSHIKNDSGVKNLSDVAKVVGISTIVVE